MSRRHLEKAEKVVENMQLYPFQEELLAQTEQYNSVLYAAEMGLGKTYIGSEKLQRIGNRLNIIVCQKSKVRDWIEHMTANYPDYCVLDLTSKKDIDTFFQIANDPTASTTVGVINYDMIWRRPQFLYLKHKPLPFTLLLDESSLLQNDKSKRTKFIMKMGAAANILLSGTVVNGAYEKLWSQSRLLGWVDRFGKPITKGDFIRRYCKTYNLDRGGYKIPIVCGYKNVPELKAELRRFGAVFKKADEVIDLPEQNFYVQKVKNTREYKVFERDKVVKIDDEVFSADMILSERQILRQLASAYNPNKLKAFKDILDSTDDRLIVFYSFNCELDALIEAIGNSRPVSIVNGKQRSMGAYEDDANSVTLVQYHAGSMGLNLQKANKIIYFSLPEGEAENYQQSLKRIHRIGQDRPCFYYHLVTEGSIDLDIIEGLNIKTERIDRLFK